jgi:hypothetical protein
MVPVLACFVGAAAAGITGKKTCILRTDEKYDATWHHWAGKGSLSGELGKQEI